MPPKGALNVPWDMEMARSVGWRVKVFALPRPAGRKDSREVFHPNEGTERRTRGSRVL